MALGITFSRPDELKRWRDEVGLTCDLLSDETREVALNYGAAENAEQEKAARIAVLIDENGTVVEAYEVQDAAGHAASVL